MKFILEWKAPLSTFSATATYFGSMTKEMDEKDSGECVHIARFSSCSDQTGLCVFEAPNVEAASAMAFNWSEDQGVLEIKSVLDDNELRELVLGKKPEFTSTYENISMEEPPEGYSIFTGKYKIREGKVMEGYDVFSNLSQDADKENNDRGGYIFMGRYHDTGEGTGYTIVAVPNATATMVLAERQFHWMRFITTVWKPVLTDKQMRKVIKAKPGYEKKLAQVKEAMAK